MQSHVRLLYMFLSFTVNPGQTAMWDSDGGLHLESFLQAICTKRSCDTVFMKMKVI